jgi:hypothetical protein
MPRNVLQLAQACRVAGTLDLPRKDLESVCRHFGINTGGITAWPAYWARTVFDKLLDA